jgi:hypothetical protein
MTDFYVGLTNEPIIDFPLNQCSDSCINGATYTFDKGYTPPPFSLTGFDQGNGIQINFEQSPFIDECTCAIECVGTPSVIDPDSITGSFCPATVNYTYNLAIESVNSGDISTFSFTFIDSNSNTGTLQVNSLLYTKPHAMSRVVFKEREYYYVELGVPFSSISGKNLIPYIDQYKVEMYEGNKDNYNTLFGWSRFSSFSSPVHILDRKHGVITKTINTGMEYGFRVSYRTIFDEESPSSEWITVKAPDDVLSA